MTQSGLGIAWVVLSIDPMRPASTARSSASPGSGTPRLSALASKHVGGRRRVAGPRGQQQQMDEYGRAALRVVAALAQHAREPVGLPQVGLAAVEQPPRVIAQHGGCARAERAEHASGQPGRQLRRAAADATTS